MEITTTTTIIIIIEADVFKIGKRIECIESKKKEDEISCLDLIVVVVRRISHEDVATIETTITIRTKAISARNLSIMIWKNTWPKRNSIMIRLK